MRDRETKRSRTDLYASVLEVLIRYSEGGKITRISYGVGVLID
jgi:predicted transcriptional regulator